MTNSTNQQTESLGFITGRFQIFHNGHLEYALQAKERVDFLIVGICNPDANTIRQNQADTFRHKLEHNPFTYWERLLMIQRSLLKVGLKQSEFEIVPCPINKPKLIANYIPLEALHLTRVYDQWGHEKIRILRELGYENLILYEAPSPDKKRTVELSINGLSPKQPLLIEEGKDVRQRLLENNNWQTFVPGGTAQIIDELDLATKLRKLQNCDPKS